MIVERSDEKGRDMIEDALAPPNRVDPTTGLPYGWSEDDEMDGFASLLTG